MRVPIASTLRLRLPGLEWISRTPARLYVGSDNELTIVLRGGSAPEWMASLEHQGIEAEELLWNLGIPPHESEPPENHQSLLREALVLIQEHSLISE